MAAAGSMQGKYTFLNLSAGTVFDAEIAPFALCPDWMLARPVGGVQQRTPGDEARGSGAAAAAAAASGGVVAEASAEVSPSPPPEKTAAGGPAS